MIECRCIDVASHDGGEGGAGEGGGGEGGAGEGRSGEGGGGEGGSIPFLAVTEPRDSDDPEAGDVSWNFWLTHMRIGFGVFLAEALVVALYLAMTSTGEHRGVLWIMVTSWITLGIVNLTTTPKVARNAGFRVKFSVAWTVTAALAAGGVAYLDGGLRSPLVLLLFLPISYAAWAFTPGAAAACGCASILSCGFLTLEKSQSVSGSAALILFAVLAGATVLSVSAALNRVRRERREAALALRIAELAATDELTGCVVRRVFRQRLVEEIARSRRHGHDLSLMMIDVDNFKSVNDTYGHLVGDNVLAALGAALRSEVRGFDIVCRLGGDEFAVLMPDTVPGTARSLAERLRAQIRTVAEVPVTLSIGISGFDRAGSLPDQIVDDADFALYQAKRAGRNAVFTYALGGDRTRERAPLR
ncbi:MAG TPA: GGDEF domain-containing protein [Acidimicrobiales bacterium]|nr:GGDEF domain-containing protein [Acidimicrobiales bacterium]